MSLDYAYLIQSEFIVSYACVINGDVLTIHVYSQYSISKVKRNGTSEGVMYDPAIAKLINTGHRTPNTIWLFHH